MRRKRSKTHPAASLPRTDRHTPEQDDVYGLPGKLPDPTVCAGCGALYRKGRWCWDAAPAEAHPTRCPACRRADDRQPAGQVRLEGRFRAAHDEEIRGLVGHVEERQKQDHPLKRILWWTEAEEEGGALEIATSDARLARAIGEALHSAYQGELDYHFTEKGNLFRVLWRR